MFDLEANKAIALRLVEVFNGRRLDLLEDVLHPESASADSQPSRQRAPRSDLALGESSTRRSIEGSPTHEPRCSTLSRKATRSYSSIASAAPIVGSSSDVPARATASSGSRPPSTPFVTAKILEDAVMTDALAMTQKLGLGPSLTKAAE
jgi:hypothetical protein